jgi:hypothetical protein
MLGANMAGSDKPFPTLGERLAAAIVSYQLGLPTVDKTLRQYAAGNVHPWWEEKALEIYKEAIRNREAHPLAPPKEGDSPDTPS